jgi:hypothetical protein
MEWELREQESNLQSHAANLEGRAREYEEHIDELISANADLHGALETMNSHSQASRAKSRDDVLRK